ncbi:hypothetical protein M951_chr189 (nucleomorph) [Lotharella oceanica]|uniref:Uncharacterized protein n=1 Tax=Lotharella oceanica TaxID=641309 RepID=A0A060DAL1_9EUKA|nr:hypothetical protein M951_chr169 [Lotharella oceanica]AIB09559.1 hypothetical protein M951_chr174 [Lotharella oceanica]AIB09563.1 hypothetical protein M951_chr179 [Lotharella oceanica]AIB09567.1 hypothetical protein M951_chr184 [Lotharella oceanica]AIB09571.1 hypothetical protein M951_chr189 [Lotharella oceanica]
MYKYDLILYQCGSRKGYLEMVPLGCLLVLVIAILDVFFSMRVEIILIIYLNYLSLEYLLRRNNIKKHG